MKRALKALIIAFITIIITLLTGAFTSSSFFTFIFPETIALREFDFTDYTYSKRNLDAKSKNIVVVNISNLDRAEVAREIEILKQYQPKVIGIDILFNCTDCPQANDSVTNKILGDAIEFGAPVVLASRLGFNQDKKNSVEGSIPQIKRNSREGLVNLITDAETPDAFVKVRKWAPKEQVGGKTQYSLGVQVALLYDSTATKKFLERANPVEWIDFYGNTNIHDNKIDYFEVIETERIFSDTSNLNILKDKIILLGFLGVDQFDTSWENKFFSPLNDKLIGLSRPDMYGVIVHANIIEMIINGDRIVEAGPNIEALVALMVCLIHVLLLLYFHQKAKVWFDAITILLIVLQLALYSYLRLLLFEYLNFRMDLSITLGSMAIASIAVNLYEGPIATLIGKLKSIA